MVFCAVSSCRNLPTFRGACALMKEAGSTYETSIKFFMSTRHRNPEYSRFHSSRREKLGVTSSLLMSLANVAPIYDCR